MFCENEEVKISPEMNFSIKSYKLSGAIILPSILFSHDVSSLHSYIIFPFIPSILSYNPLFILSRIQNGFFPVHHRNNTICPQWNNVKFAIRESFFNFFRSFNPFFSILTTAKTSVHFFNFILSHKPKRKKRKIC